MKKTIENYGGEIIFYIILVIGLILLNSPLNRNNVSSKPVTSISINN